MSNADRPPRQWRFYVVDMIEFAKAVRAYGRWAVPLDDVLPHIRSAVGVRRHGCFPAIGGN